MKRIAIVMFALLVTSNLTFAQQSKPSPEVTDKQWLELFQAVNNENWDTAVNLSSKYLIQLKDDDERLPRVRYIYLYSAAGKVAEGTMLRDELEKRLKDFVGKKIVMPYREIALDCTNSLNFICPSNDKDNLLITAASNKNGTTILAFEYVQLQEKFDVSNHEGQQATVGGILQSIELNPNVSRIWVMRMRVEKGFIKLREQSKPTARANNSFNRSGNRVAFIIQH